MYLLYLQMQEGAFLLGDGTDYSLMKSIVLWGFFNVCKGTRQVAFKEKKCVNVFLNQTHVSTTSYWTA